MSRSYPRATAMRNSRKSIWRANHKIASGVDSGQRWAVAYEDGMGTTRYFGFTDSVKDRDTMIKAVSQNPMWKNPRYIDRGSQGGA